MMKVSLNLLIYGEPYWVVQRCLDSVVDIVDELVIFVDHKWSTDRLLKDYEVVFIKSLDLEGSVVEEHRNDMIDLSNGDWVLILDPDEYLDKEAKALFQGQGLNLYNNQEIVGVVFPRKNYERDKDGLAHHIANYPDHQIRIIKKDSGLRYSGRIHEPPRVPRYKILVMGKGHIIHDKLYQSQVEWDRKYELYTKKEKER